MQLIIEVEDGLREVIEAPGNKQAIETACYKKIFELRDAFFDKASRQSVMSRGFIGTDKK